MYIKDGIAYSSEHDRDITVVSVRALDEYKLWIRFSTGETKVFDFTPILDKGMFNILKDKKIFNTVYVDFGVPVWCDGEIDIAPERLYYEGVSV